jgi:hypothetical protein
VEYRAPFPHQHTTTASTTRRRRSALNRVRHLAKAAACAPPTTLTPSFFAAIEGGVGWRPRRRADGADDGGRELACFAHVAVQKLGAGR